MSTANSSPTLASVEQEVNRSDEVRPNESRPRDEDEDDADEDANGSSSKGGRSPSRRVAANGNGFLEVSTAAGGSGLAPAENGC
jgi:hypothetical protein